MSPIPGVHETVLVAPDSFKGTFTSPQVAALIGEGLVSGGRPVDLCPVADGGEGTAAALLSALGGEEIVVAVHDPLGRPVSAPFGLSGSDAFVDTAAASGLSLVAEHERDAFAASTVGTGELILAAAAAGARTIHLGVGGSATTDGGAGALSVIEDAGGLNGARLIILCDVRTPFEDAARVFAAQKGADPDTITRLNRRLARLARRLPRDPYGLEMGGAAGGLAGGLWAALDAQLVGGAAFVLNAVGFDARMRAARCVVTGEGRFDAQSLVGKLVSEIATRARQGGVPCHVVCGMRDLDPMGARVLDLERVLLASTADELWSAGRQLADLI